MRLIQTKHIWQCSRMDFNSINLNEYFLHYFVQLFCVCNCVGLWVYISVYMHDFRWQQENGYPSNQSWPTHCCATSHCTEEVKGNNGGKEPGNHIPSDNPHNPVSHVLDVHVSTEAGDFKSWSHSVPLCGVMTCIVVVASFRTAISSNTGCLIASVKSVMTAMRSSQPSVAVTTAGCVDRSSVAAAATRRFLENSWVTQVNSISEHRSIHTK